MYPIIQIYICKYICTPALRAGVQIQPFCGLQLFPLTRTSKGWEPQMKPAFGLPAAS